MNNRSIATVLILIGIITLMGLVINEPNPSYREVVTSTAAGQERNNDVLRNDQSLLLVGENALYVADQTVTDSVRVAQVILKSPGFVVIQEENKSEPGDIIGTSALLSSGGTSNFIIQVTPEAGEEELYASLYLDNGDGVFTPLDEPVLDRNGQPIMMKFHTTGGGGDEEILL